MSARIALARGILDLDRGVLEADGPIGLTTREVALLARLCAQPGVTIPRDELLTAVFGYHPTSQSRAVDQTVKRLRAKIEADPERPAHLLTVHGTGYRFEPLAVAAAPAPAAVADPPLVLGACTLDLRARTFVGPGGPGTLTEHEADLLRHLAARRGEVVAKEELGKRVWGRTQRGRALDNTLARLRAKIEGDPASPRFLLTVAGGGLRLAAIAPPHNVGAETTTFSGRQVELSAIGTAFSTGSRLVTLCGTGGIGKTRLARRHAAREIEAGRGAWFVDLAPITDPDGLSSTVAAALGILDVRQIGGALAARGPVLLILDNLEQVVGPAGDLVARWLSEAPRLCILATSRERLRVSGEALVALDGLPLDDAAALFTSRARDVAPEIPLDEAAVRRVAADLEGIPLAIELAASRLRVFGLDELARRLGSGLAILRGGPRDAPARHATLQATIAWSWDLLGDGEREVLVAASIFRDPFTVEALERLLPGAPVADRLETLLDRSLVRRQVAEDGPRFRLFEVIRSFAAAHADASLPERHARSVLAWVSEPREGPSGVVNQQQARQQALVRGDLLAAWAWLRDHDPAAMIRLMLAVRRYFYVTLPADTFIAMADAALEVATDSADRARLLGDRGARKAFVGRFDEARADLLAGRAASDDLRATRRAHISLARLTFDQGDAAGALALHEALAEGLLRAPDPEDEAIVTLERTLVLMTLDRWDEALGSLQRSHDLKLANGDTDGRISTHHMFGHFALRAGDFQGWKRHVHDAWRIAAGTTTRNAQFAAIYLANVLLYEGRTPEAEALLLGARETLAQRGFPAFLAMVELPMFRARALAGDLQGSLAVCERSLAAFPRGTRDALGKRLHAGRLTALAGLGRVAEAEAGLEGFEPSEDLDFAKAAIAAAKGDVAPARALLAAPPPLREPDQLLSMRLLERLVRS